MTETPLSKLTIQVETQPGKFGSAFQVLFNPTELTLDKTVQWRKMEVAEQNSPDLGFTHGEPVTLSMNLFFDTYETREDIRKHIAPVQALVNVNEALRRPPRCKLSWGNYNFGGFQWVATKLTQRFTLFLEDGLPARAVLTCSFQQWRSIKEEKEQTGAGVARTRTFRYGETLSSIAAEEYNDPELWRPIAEANGIDNPRQQLKPGQVLTIPPLQPGQR